MISGKSPASQATITATFQVGTNVDDAAVNINNRVKVAEPRLPEEVRRQGISVRKRSPDLSLVVNLISPDGRYDAVYLSNYALLQIRDTLARIPGVGFESLPHGFDFDSGYALTDFKSGPFRVRAVRGGF